ncbi:unnamed protein product [Rotaria sp. Silwood1]|nr:unnamed protein product [Rotaria sp. Silwood1]
MASLFDDKRLAGCNSNLFGSYDRLERRCKQLFSLSPDMRVGGSVSSLSPIISSIGASVVNLLVIEPGGELIVGGADTDVIKMNEEANSQMIQLKDNKKQKALKLVPNATHLFEEKGALEQVSQLAIQWFTDHFQKH